MINAPKMKLSRGYVLQFLHGQYFWIGAYDDPHDGLILTSEGNPRKFLEKALADLDKEEAFQAKRQKKTPKKKKTTKCSGCGHVKTKHRRGTPDSIAFCHATPRCNCINFGRGVGPQ